MSINDLTKEETLKSRRFKKEKAAMRPVMEARDKIEEKRELAAILKDGDEYFEQLFKEVAA